MQQRAFGSSNEIQDGLVSVITPAFNAARFIRQTIESVRAQIYPRWEMIIADDCSRDNTCEIVESLARQDGRIRLIRLANNHGPALARNCALGAAKGRYIAFLDSDDLWLPEKLEHQVAFMKERDVAFSYTQYRLMSEKGDKVGKLVSCPPSLNYWGLLKNTAGLGCLTVMIDRKKTGPFKMVNFRPEDFILWLHLLKFGFTAYGLQEDLARYRHVEGSDSSNVWTCAKWTWAIYRRIEQLSAPYAAWCFINYAWRAYCKRRTL